MAHEIQFRRALVLSTVVVVGASQCVPIAHARQSACDSPAPATFTVSLPKLGQPPDDEGQGWSRPSVWAGHSGATSDTITIPNGRPIYALLVSGYGQNAYLDELIFYNFARHLMARGAYVHYAWWNNLLAPYMERPLHYSQSHPGTITDLTTFTTAAQADDKAVPSEDYQFLADAKLLLSAIRANNPSAIIIVAGHSMGGGAVVHLGDQTTVLVDILAPIDPVGNRNFPWAGPGLHRNDYFFNWTRWRATRNTFLGFQQRIFFDGCDPSPPWLADIGDATSACPAGPYVHPAGAVRFGSNIINLFHRWQDEALFPFDYQDTYSFQHSRPTGGTTSQALVHTDASGSDPGGWPPGNGGQQCCPVGPGISWPADGHGEIVGFRGPGSTYPLAVQVKRSPYCGSCPNLTWPARVLDNDVWSNPNSGTRRNLLIALESLPQGQSWSYEPYNPDLCLVSSGLVSLYNSMNKPPVADAGPDQTIVCDHCTTTPVTLDAGGSTDPNNDTLTYSWSWNFGAATGQVAQFDMPAGTHCVTLEVEDPSGHISRDHVTVTVVDPSADIIPYTRLAEEWKRDAGSFEGRAFDEFFRGVPNDTRCLLNPPTSPATINLARGTLTVSARTGVTPYCAIEDLSTTPAVSDAVINSAQSLLTFAFDPPITAFYTYYGSLAIDRVATMALYAPDGTFIRAIASPPSSAASLATGQGFTSTVPIARIEFSSTEPGAVLVGAFVGLRTGEQSLGTVTIPGYSGPDGATVEMDFACTFAALCAADFNADGFLDFFDVDAFLACFESEECPPGRTADYNGDGFADFFDYDSFVADFEAGC